jgi:hypothetical protein
VASPNLASRLRDTIRRVEEGTGISPDDPVLIELKRVLLLKLASIETEHETLSRPGKPETQSI